MESREKFFGFGSLYGLFLNRVHHVVVFLDFKQQKTTLDKLSKKGMCWKTARSSE